MDLLTLFSFLFFTGLVALGTWLLTRRRLADDSAGYFLAGRTLTGGYIAGSLLMTNLSTEQLVGLNGSAFTDGLSVMAWEVIAAFSLVVMALVFLPRFLRSGIATVPEFLEERYDARARTITTLIFIAAYAIIVLPMILYTGASALMDILNVRELTGIADRTTNLWIVVWLVGIVGSIYAIFGGLRAVAVSDTLNGFLLLAGGVLIAWLALREVNADGPLAALRELRDAEPDRFNSLGGPKQQVPFPTLFTGVLLINLFYWCTNQQIIQRTFGATNLAEGQKGVLIAGLFKILAPLILVLPGIVALHLYGRVVVDGQRVPVKAVTDEEWAVVGTSGDEEVILLGGEAADALRVATPEAARAKVGQTVTFGKKELAVEKVVGSHVAIVEDPAGGNRYLEGVEVNSLVGRFKADRAFPVLVRNILPSPLAGFFAAVIVGAVLSSFNSVLNSSATLYSLGVYKGIVRPDATDAQVVASGRAFGWVVAVLSMIGAPFLAGQTSIFAYLQTMNGLYFIPIFAVVVVGFWTRRVPAVAASVALVAGVTLIALGYFVPPLAEQVAKVGNFHFLAMVFAGLILLMLLIGLVAPRPTPWEQRDARVVDLTPWRLAVPVGVGMVLLVVAIYVTLADPKAAGWW